MRLTKIYTKMGDQGSTMLASGEMVPKADRRIEAFGSIDELNAFVGLLCDELHLLGDARFADIVLALKKIQNELFDVGGELATPLDHLDINKQQVVGADHIARLEQEIDRMNANLPPLQNFVLPGGHRANSLAHVCRTICRRSERQIVRLSETTPLRNEMIVFTNRLSDWFFVLSRNISSLIGAPEVLWEQRR